MDDSDQIYAQKQRAARAAVAEVADGMVVGLGTGSTAAYAVAALGERVAAGLTVRAVATSLHTHAAARAAGIDVIALPASGVIDLCIDGVDEIDPEFRAIKGGGGAMLREKVVAQAATRMIAIADGSKTVARLGARPVPLEVLDFARGLVAREVRALGGVAVLRAGVLSDQRNPLLDCDFGTIDSPEALAAALSAIPGMLGHGLFLREIDSLYIGTDRDFIRRDRARANSDG